MIRFVHFQEDFLFQRYRGFTVAFETRLLSDIEGRPLTYVQYQVAKCSKNDQFCKATGRSTALAAPMRFVEVREFPGVIAQLAEDMYNNGPARRQDINQWAWLYKYFLPR